MATTAQAVVPAHGGGTGQGSVETHPASQQIAICLSTPPAANELHRIPIAVTGSWVKNGHRFSITMSDLKSILSNFKSRNNAELIADYEHASEQPRVAQGNPVPASGWIKGLSIVGSMLYADVEWTDRARDMITAKEYRFVSPAIDWGQKDKKSGESMGATLTSLALTNHPFLEELPALMLSEVDGVATAELQIEAKDSTAAKLSELSFNARQTAINTAIRTRYQSNPLTTPYSVGGLDFWVNEIFDDYAIAQSGNKYWRFSYSIDENGNATCGDPVQVKQTYVEASEVNMADQPKKDEKEEVEKKDATSKEKQVDAVKDEPKDKPVKDGAKDDGKTAKDGEGEDTDAGEELSATFSTDGTPVTMSDGKETKLPRFLVRRMKGRDGVGKLSHHALVAADGKKLCGYITASDMAAHVARCTETLGDKTLASETAVVDFLREKTGHPKLALSDVTEGVELMIEHGDAIAEQNRAKEARKVLLSEAFTKDSFDQKKARRLVATEKVTMNDWCDFEDAVDAANAAISAGKFLPRQRQELIQLYLSDKELFSALSEKQMNVVDFEQHGHRAPDGDVANPGTLTASDELDTATKKLMSEKNLSYSDAFKEVRRTNPEVNKRYAEETRKRVQRGVQ